jgi:uncharacterized protein
MRIEVEKLTPEGAPFAHTYAEDDLPFDEDRARLVGETAVNGRASRHGEEVRVEGKIGSQVELACDRCLRPVAGPLEVEFRESFMPQALDAEARDERELHRDDLHLSIYEGDAVDIDELVREQLLLALPSRFVCREECKGLCLTCGADLNEGSCECPKGEIDPRWAALEEFKSRKS